MAEKILLICRLIKTTKRITFDIEFQHPDVTNTNPEEIIAFKASNGYDVISEHRMDIQSRRIWLLGASNDQTSERSGTMAIPTHEMTEDSYDGFLLALLEWALHNNGSVKIKE